MMTLSLTRPYLRPVPDVMRPFGKAGKVDDIFRPRIFREWDFRDCYRLWREL